MTRHTSVAGTWYPDAPVRLAADVDRYVADARVDPVPHPPRALIAPHAGLMYSGPVAAHAYKLARDGRYSAAVLVGPSHFVPFRGVSMWAEGQWESPFGPVSVDADLAGAVRAECREIVDVPSAHGREHSLEMQLPFVAHLLPGVPIVPLVMGHQTRETAFALGNALARVLARRISNASNVSNVSNAPNDSNDSNDSNVLLIASSDLSHYEDAAVAAAMDAVVVRRVEALDPDGLMDALEQEPQHACGGGPMVSVLQAARAAGAAHARVVRYADSGDVSGDKTAVVGYMAAVVW